MLVAVSPALIVYFFEWTRNSFLMNRYEFIIAQRTATDYDRILSFSLHPQLFTLFIHHPERKHRNLFVPSKSLLTDGNAWHIVRNTFFSAVYKPRNAFASSFLFHHFSNSFAAVSCTEEKFMVEEAIILTVNVKDGVRAQLVFS